MLINVAFSGGAFYLIRPIAKRTATAPLLTFSNLHCRNWFSIIIVFIIANRDPSQWIEIIDIYKARFALLWEKISIFKYCFYIRMSIFGVSIRPKVTSPEIKQRLNMNILKKNRIYPHGTTPLFRCLQKQLGCSGKDFSYCCCCWNFQINIILSITEKYTKLSYVFNENILRYFYFHRLQVRQFFYIF